MQPLQLKWHLPNSSNSFTVIADEIEVQDGRYLGKTFGKRYGVPSAACRRNDIRKHGKHWH